MEINQFKEVKPNVLAYEDSNRRITIVGTAHVSKSSAELVEQTIREQMPDTVCIELCQSRYDNLTNPESWRNTDLFEIIKSGKTYLLLSQLVLSAFQKRIADKIGIRPGEEIRRAIEVSQELNIKISLIDREVKTTLKRAWHNASLLSMVKLMSSLFLSLFSKEEVTEDQIEKLKDHHDLTVVINEFGENLPGVKKALIDERDQYLIAKIKQNESNNIVAVVGAGHTPGMIKNYGKEISIEKLDEIPPSPLSFKILKYSIPILVIAVFIWGFFNLDTKKSFEIFLVWFLANGIFSALGTLIALGHPLTILTAFIAAPFTSLNPTIAAGWVAGLVESFLRKPKVRDLETIAQDLSSIKGVYKNQISRILLVVILANLGSTIGTFAGIGLISKIILD